MRHNDLLEIRSTRVRDFLISQDPEKLVQEAIEARSQAQETSLQS